MKKILYSLFLNLAMKFFRTLDKEEQNHLPFVWAVNIQWYRYRHPEAKSMSDDEILAILKEEDSR